jgi:hypothetical protein
VAVTRLVRQVLIEQNDGDSVQQLTCKDAKDQLMTSCTACRGLQQRVWTPWSVSSMCPSSRRRVKQGDRYQVGHLYPTVRTLLQRLYRDRGLSNRAEASQCY